MKKAVIFDLDGTLIDSLEDIAINANKVLQQLNCPTHSIEQYKHFVGDGARVLIENAMPKYISKNYLNEALNLFIEFYEQNLHTNTKPYEGIKELLEQLVSQGILLAVLSNKPDKFTKLYVQKLLGDIPFVEVSGQKETVNKKPDPAGAFTIANRFQIEPQDIYFVGDTSTDMKTAKNANMVAVGVSWGFRTVKELEENGADFIIKKPQELLDL
jgi:phosphoglycolate phosphatase